MVSPLNPTKYLGPNVYLAPTVVRDRQPTLADYRQPETGKNYPLCTSWQVGKNPTTGVEGEIWLLSKIVANQGYWVQVNGSSGITSVLTANATPQFNVVGSVSTVDFNLTNLLLGSDGSNITSGDFNTGLGSRVLESVTTGVGNTCLGTSTGFSITTGSQNTLIGFSAGDQITTSNNNVAIGAGSLTNFDSAPGSGSNLCIGLNSMLNATSGGFNTAIGTGALSAATAPEGNIAIGLDSASAYTTTESLNIIIGNNVTGVIGESNVTRIGTGQTECYVSGISGVAVSNLEVVTIDTLTGQLGSQPSSGGIQTARITLTSTQIKNLNATPIAIIPAQGAGTLIVPMSCVAKFIYGGSNVFVAAAAQSISVAFVPTSVIGSGCIVNSTLTGTVNNCKITALTSTNFTAATDGENQPLYAYNFTATEISGNAADDNTVVIEIQYYVVTL